MPVSKSFWGEEWGPLDIVDPLSTTPRKSFVFHCTLHRSYSSALYATRSWNWWKHHIKVKEIYLVFPRCFVETTWRKCLFSPFLSKLRMNQRCHVWVCCGDLPRTKQFWSPEDQKIIFLHACLIERSFRRLICCSWYYNSDLKYVFQHTVQLYLRSNILLHRIILCPPPTLLLVWTILVWLLISMALPVILCHCGG